MSYIESAVPVKSQVAASGLKTSRLTFCEAAMMIVGSTIGSGVLGLAYASRRAGWPVLVIWLAVAALISAVSMLYVAEASLRTRLPLQLSGLAEKYIGKAGSWLLFFAVGATSFCSLIVYTNGCGKILADLLGISFEAGSLLFILPAVGVIWFGLKATGVAEKFISSGMIAMLLVLAGASFLSSRVPVGGYPLRGLDVCDADLQYHGLLLCGAVHGAGSRARLCAPAGETRAVDPRGLCDFLRDPCDRSALCLPDAAALRNH